MTETTALAAMPDGRPLRELVPPPGVKLTDGSWRVVVGLARGLRLDAVATELGITPSAAQQRLQTAYDATGVHTMAGLVAMCFRQGLEAMDEVGERTLAPADPPDDQALAFQSAPDGDGFHVHAWSSGPTDTASLMLLRQDTEVGWALVHEGDRQRLAAALLGVELPPGHHLVVKRSPLVVGPVQRAATAAAPSTASAPAPGRESPRREAIAAWWRAALDERVDVGGGRKAHVGDLTRQQLLTAAGMHHRDAEARERRAQAFRRLGDLLAHHGVARVRDLPDLVLQQSLPPLTGYGPPRPQG